MREKELDSQETIEHEAHVQRMYELVSDLKDKIDFYPAACIAGKDDEKAWAIRDELIETNPDGVVQGLAGITSERSWEIRESVMDMYPHSVARSLAGLNDSRALEMRTKLLSEYIDREGVANGLAESVACLDDKDSWELREELEDKCVDNVLEGIIGVNSERAWQLREKHIDSRPREVAGSLIGLENEQANQMRDRCLEKGAIDGVILSYMGSDTEEAWHLRDEYIDRYPFAVSTSMAGLENQRSWEVRDRLMQRADNEGNERIYKGVAQSLSPYMHAALKISR